MAKKRKNPKFKKGDRVCWIPYKRRKICGRVFDANPRIAPGAIGVKTDNREKIYPLKKLLKKQGKKTNTNRREFI